MGTVSIENIKPSRAIPESIRSDEMNKFLDVLDYMYARQYGEIVKLRSTIDVDTCPEELLPYHAKELGLILPDFATASAKRALLRNAMTLHNRRFTISGFEFYLNTAFTGLNIAVEVQADTNYGGILFYGNLPDCSYPNWDEMKTAGGVNDICRYLISGDTFAKSYTLTITGEGIGSLTQEIRDFCNEVGRWFCPMGDSESFTLNFVFIENP